MSLLQILPVYKLKKSQIFIPGSKSYSNRILILAALNSQKAILKGLCQGQDTQILIANLKKLKIEIGNLDSNQVLIQGNNGNFEELKVDLFTGISGISSRFLTALCSLIPGDITIDAEERMLERPMEDLIEPLKKLNCQIEYLNKESFLPIRFLNKKAIQGGKISLNGEISSQFLSSLLLIAPVLKEGLEIEIINEQISKSYIQSTLEVMEHIGLKVENQNYKSYQILPQQIQFSNYSVPGDITGAGYFWALAAIMNQTVRTLNISPDLEQGDIKLAKILEQMGCKVSFNQPEEFIEITGTPNLKALEIDMQDLPDSAQTLAIVCAFSQGKSILRGLSTLKLKETDRIFATSKELEKMGIRTEIGEDFLVIYGGEPKPAKIKTYNDHRMAMSFAIAGAKIEGLQIENSEVVNKSFPNFWEMLKELGVDTLKV